MKKQKQKPQTVSMFIIFIWFFVCVSIQTERLRKNKEPFILNENIHKTLLKIDIIVLPSAKRFHGLCMCLRLCLFLFELLMRNNHLSARTHIILLRLA